MNLNNPILVCGGIAFGIVLLLIIVVVICCKRSASKEREELKELSSEIEADFSNSVIDCDDSKIENVLSKMQDVLDSKEESSVTFEQEQEENAIISYQELLDSLGAKNSIDIDSIDLYDDELDNKIEISDFNKEIIDAYQSDSVDREIYRFQNDYSSEALPMDVVSESPVMNFDFSSTSFDVDSGKSEDVYEVRHGEVSNHKKFRRTEVISPIYGIVDDRKSIFDIEDDVEKIDL